MKSIGIVFCFVLAIALGAGIGFAQVASVEKGKAMFSDPKLGTNGKTCNDCHPNGKGLEKSGMRKDLEEIVNGCITENLKGKALGMKSPDMQSMVMYIKSIGKKPAAAGY